MAFSANVLARSRSVIRLDSPFIRSHSSRLACNSRGTSVPLRRRMIAAAAAAAAAVNVVVDVERPEEVSALDSGWTEFARRVSGEWDGYGADFTTDGGPIELPESVVPEAYREWEVKVFDWQTQCPTLAQTEEPTLFYKSIKLLPTVGCEADAATQYSIDERHIGGLNNKVSTFAYHSTGSYAATWPVEDNTGYKLLELEHCLVDPRNHESRVRLTQVVRVEGTTMTLQNIKVLCEQWYGPFRNGDQLGGCAIRDSGFASTEALKVSEVVGVWEGPTSVASFQNPHTTILQELVGHKLRKSQRDQDGLVPLPRHLWCSFKENEAGEICGEVGWLLDRGQALCSRFVFSVEGSLKEIAITREALVSE
ncbi:hypothetical protein H6P81_018355 [Aristolochia fimbriata]|uniref:Uncharacterized protein n=1 Tax=Aristolochia fimbriata TaxID=158543 RepID=A0AAV7E410_ARIFI|nr:hypothetical protein H6P81_018355 [Aristolochia fimbriata]